MYIWHKDVCSGIRYAGSHQVGSVFTVFLHSCSVFRCAVCDWGNVKTPHNDVLCFRLRLRVLESKYVVINGENNSDRFVCRYGKRE